MNVRASIEENLQILVLERREEGYNVVRYYVLSVHPTLLAEASLVPEWGRIGSKGRRLVKLRGTPQLAGVALEKWLAGRTRQRLRP
jgi:predicted DNA-binding WGR domain protein